VVPEPDVRAESVVRTASPEELEWMPNKAIVWRGAVPKTFLPGRSSVFPRFTMATGLGPEGCVIISMLAKIEPRVYIFNLDTATSS